MSPRNLGADPPSLPQSWPEVLTAHEVADYLRINYMTVLKMTRDGRLPALAIGREYRYLRAEVERLMRSAGGPPTGA